MLPYTRNGHWTDLKCKFMAIDQLITATGNLKLDNHECIQISSILEEFASQFLDFVQRIKCPTVDSKSSRPVYRRISISPTPDTTIAVSDNGNGTVYSSRSLSTESDKNATPESESLGVASSVTHVRIQDGRITDLPESVVDASLPEENPQITELINPQSTEFLNRQVINDPLATGFPIPSTSQNTEFSRSLDASSEHQSVSNNPYSNGSKNAEFSQPLNNGLITVDDLSVAIDNRRSQLNADKCKIDALNLTILDSIKKVVDAREIEKESAVRSEIETKLSIINLETEKLSKKKSKKINKRSVQGSVESRPESVVSLETESENRASSAGAIHEKRTSTSSRSDSGYKILTSIDENNIEWLDIESDDDAMLDDDVSSRSITPPSAQNQTTPPDVSNCSITLSTDNIGNRPGTGKSPDPKLNCNTSVLLEHLDTPPKLVTVSFGEDSAPKSGKKSTKKSDGPTPTKRPRYNEFKHDLSTIRSRLNFVLNPDVQIELNNIRSQMRGMTVSQKVLHLLKVNRSMENSRNICFHLGFYIHVLYTHDGGTYPEYFPKKNASREEGNISLNYAQQLHRLYLALGKYRTLVHSEIGIRQIVKAMKNLVTSLDGLPPEEKQFWIMPEGSDPYGFLTAYKEFFKLKCNPVYPLDLLDNGIRFIDRQFIEQQSYVIDVEIPDTVALNDIIAEQQESKLILLYDNDADVTHCSVIYINTKDGTYDTKDKTLEKDLFMGNMKNINIYRPIEIEMKF